MAQITTQFFYRLDQNGSSNNGKVVVELVGDSEATSTEDDGTLTAGEQFTVVFTSNATNTLFGGVYTYIGFDPAFDGFIAQDSQGNFFLFSHDGNIPPGTNLNGIIDEDFAVCFLAGTMIRCPDGERAVETLAVGDLVLAADGRSVPVRWIGRQTLSPLFGMPEGRLPVRIAAGALGNNLPVRDLRVTADHALLIDGVLVHAGALVNGITIRRIPRSELGERFVVYHVETESHAIILAEGVPAETFVDNVSRRHFDNYAEFEALYGTAPVGIMELPHPRAMSARQVPLAIRALVATRAEAISPVIDQVA